MADKQTVQTEAAFSKEQLLKSEKYKQHRDILSSQLADDVSYTAAEADKAINDFLKRGVK